jgi:hypothetical protein
MDDEALQDVHAGHCNFRLSDTKLTKDNEAKMIRGSIVVVGHVQGTVFEVLAPLAMRSQLGKPPITQKLNLFSVRSATFN